ncbi:MAG: hypothetical protein R3B49_03065 [Phycisphaerales bacterium]
MTKPPDLADIEAQIERLTIQKDEAVKNADYGRRPPSCPIQAEKLRQQKEDTQKAWRDKQREASGTVDEDVIASRVEDDRCAADASGEGGGAPAPARERTAQER